MQSLGRRPAAFAALVAVFYALLILPMAVSRNFDLSVFVLAGDVYVDHTKSAAPLATVPHSYGYDGQFFYRLARQPLSVAPTLEGVRFDAPAKRMQRILYPALAYVLSWGSSALTPAALVLVNLAGLAVIGGTAAGLTRRRQLAWWFPFAIAGWPGFLVALTHDTAEIVATAFLLLALASYLSNRMGAYALAAAAATLTRETAIPIFLGPLLFESWSWLASPNAARFRRAALCALALAPFAIWHETVGALWNETAQPLVGNRDLGWPLMGVAEMLWGQISSGFDSEAGAMATPFHRAFVSATVVGLIVFCGAVALRWCRTTKIPGAAGLALGWLLILLLMSLMTATGPWAGPQGYFRAFTECWVLGCLLLAMSPTIPAPGGALRLVAVFAAADVVFITWKLCLGVLPA